MDQIVSLNVGGTKYITSKLTLCTTHAQEQSPSSFFDIMFSGQMQSGLLIDDAIFIDRNGQLFQHVLDYLRNRDRWEAPEDPKLILDLITESDFFNLPGLIERIRVRIPPYRRPFEIRMMTVSNGGVRSVFLAQGVPETVRAALQNELQVAFKETGYYALKEIKYGILNMIVLTIASEYRLAHTVPLFQDPPKGLTEILLIFEDYFSSPIYSTLRGKLYPHGPNGPNLP